ncbi:MAG: pyridoxal-phosphate dependent enzyme [Elusimicrobia bacterium]|nr:pyridoxal-phosphate dependent enzyme [Elusimicrobiota bacterium]
MATKNQVLENTIKRCRERNIIIPTYEQMRDPDKIPQAIKDDLKDIGLWDLNPRNLFRITWKNEPVKKGGGFGGVNYLEIPRQISGVKARIIMLIGKYFPTGAHKVGATFGPLVSRLIHGDFDPTTQKAVWPSTGNYCRGGAYDSYLLACDSIAILPEGMSKERFEWLKKVGAEIFATPGCESNVKEIYDKCHELKKERGDKIVILNQFDEIGNAIWHYAVTGTAMEEVFNKEKKAGQRMSALCLTQGSAGTLGSGEYLKTRFPKIKVCAAEALQCPTLLYNGYGGHRIEGIGDKHVPWIHNLKNTDMVVDIDDEATIAVMRLFNKKAGHKFLQGIGVKQDFIDKLELLGISSIANMLTCIKAAKYYEMNENDIVFSLCTDSMEMYQSRVSEYDSKDGEYTDKNAAVHYGKYLENLGTDYMLETSYYDRKRMHNLKYFTWVEQQGKDVKELNDQWYQEDYWQKQFDSVKEWDEKINEFNERTGLLKKL